MEAQDAVRVAVIMGSKCDWTTMPRAAESGIVAFEKESSVMLARDLDGSVHFCPIAENTHRRHILTLDEDGQDGAESIAAELERAVAAGPRERPWT